MKKPAKFSETAEIEKQGMTTWNSEINFNVSLFNQCQWYVLSMAVQFQAHDDRRKLIIRYLLTSCLTFILSTHF